MSEIVKKAVSKKGKIIGIAVGSTVIAITGGIIYKKLKVKKEIIPTPVSKAAEQINITKMHLQSARDTSKEAIQTSKESIQALAERDWEKAYTYMYDTTLKLFNVSIQLVDAAISASNTKEEQEKNDWLNAKKNADSQRIQNTILLITLFHQGELDKKTKAEKAEYERVKKEEEAERKQLKLDRAELVKEKGEWMNKRGEFYNLVRDGYTELRIAGQSDKTSRKTVKKIIEKEVKS